MSSTAVDYDYEIDYDAVLDYDGVGDLAVKVGGKPKYLVVDRTPKVKKVKQPEFILPPPEEKEFIKEESSKRRAILYFLATE